MADVAHIVSDVRARGAEGLRHWAIELDGVEPARAVPDSDAARDKMRAAEFESRRPD